MFFIKKRIFVLVLSMVFLASCSKHRVINPGQTLSLQEDETLALMSVTRSGKRKLPADLYYRGIDKATRGFSGTISIMGQDDWSLNTSHDTSGVDEYEGRIVLIGLPAGKYEFYTFSIRSGFMNYDWLTGKRFSFPFELKSGVTNYIGNFHVWSGELDISETLPLHYSLENKSERDLAKFKEKYPKLHHQKIFSLFSTEETFSSSVTTLSAAENMDKARSLYWDRDYHEALRYINESIKANDQSSKAFLFRAEIYLEMRLYKGALSDYKEALRLGYPNSKNIKMMIRILQKKIEQNL